MTITNNNWCFIVGVIGGIMMLLLLYIAVIVVIVVSVIVIIVMIVVIVMLLWLLLLFVDTIKISTTMVKIVVFVQQTTIMTNGCLTHSQQTNK